MRRQSFPSVMGPLIARGGATVAAAAAASGGGGPMKAVIFNNLPFLQSQKILLGANILGYFLTVTTKSHYHVDLLGTGAFALATIPSLLSPPALTTRVQWSAAIVSTWSLKLAAFLFYRVLQLGHDSRLDEVLDSPYYAAGFWTFSWLWGALASLPHTLGSTSSLVGNPLLLRVGTAIAVLGFTVETLADWQKWKFKSKHPGQFCDAGLWSISQHPNWFGNLLLWSGVVIMNASALVEPRAAGVAKSNVLSALWRFRRVGLALISPCFMWYVFSGQATGRLLPDAVVAYKKRYGYGTNAAFTEYVDTTPLIVPNPLQIFGKFFSSKKVQ